MWRSSYCPGDPAPQRQYDIKEEEGERQKEVQEAKGEERERESEIDRDVGERVTQRAHETWR